MTSADPQPAETAPDPRPTALGARRVVIAGLIPFLGHALTIGAGFVAARVVAPSGGGGMEDAAAVAVTFLGLQFLFAAVAFIAMIVFLVQRKPVMALAVLGGWVIGLAGVLLFFTAVSR